MTMRNSDFETAFLRAALAAGFFSAVADRFGVWGPPGTQHIAWGNMTHFFRYVAILNPWFPAALIPTVGWLATFAEIALGLFLLIGFQTRWAARLSGLLLFAFAFGMTAGTNVKSAFDASVFAASAGAFSAGQSIEISLEHRFDDTNQIRFRSKQGKNVVTAFEDLAQASKDWARGTLPTV